MRLVGAEENVLLRTAKDNTQPRTAKQISESSALSFVPFVAKLKRQLSIPF
jgi:hypothetical protein